MNPIIYYCQKCDYKRTSKLTKGNTCPKCGGMILSGYEREELLEYLQNEVLPRRIKCRDYLVKTITNEVIKKKFLKDADKSIMKAKKQIKKLKRKTAKDYYIAINSEINELIK